MFKYSDALFQLPVGPDAWKGTLDATKSTKICMQTMKENPYNLTLTEDCLLLNIYVPLVRNCFEFVFCIYFKYSKLKKEAKLHQSSKVYISIIKLNA